MDKELCFSIEDTDLYLEQVLVDYMDVPIFFLCKGGAQYYLVLCTDVDELSYIVVKLSSLDVYNLLHGNISMRDAILKQREYWDIVSGDEIYLDEVTKKHIEEIELDTLPEKDACFKALTKQVKLFVQKFDREFLAARNFCESDKKANLSEASVDFPFGVLLKGIDQYIEVEEFKMEKLIFFKNSLYNEKYNEKMKVISATEITVKDYERSEQKEEVFGLTEMSINNVTVAA